MIKFSIIIPVYNTEDYLSSCLDSVLSQSYNDFEVIVVNDGTKDNSQEIIDKYVRKDKKIRSFIKENGGLSSARNYGVDKSNGEYLLFLDSDDTLNKDLLKELNKEIESNKPDIIRFQITRISDKEKEDTSELFSNLTGIDAMKKLSKNDYFVSACSSCYNTRFFKDNNFKYELGKYHEDYGLTPYIYLKASKVSSIPYHGYNYYEREGSIMLSKDKEYKKAKDTLDLFDINIKKVEDESIKEEDKKYFRSYMTNGLINKCASLDKDNFNKLFEEVKKRNLSKYLMDDSLPRKTKKIIYKLMPKYYMKHIK